MTLHQYVIINTLNITGSYIYAANKAAIIVLPSGEKEAMRISTFHAMLSKGYLRQWTGAGNRYVPTAKAEAAYDKLQSDAKRKSKTVDVEFLSEAEW